MKEVRELFQSKFNDISTIESGPPIPDSIIEEGTTYFGYELQESFLNSDTDSNYAMQISIIGTLVRKDIATENTLEIIDEALESLKEKLKELHIRYSYKDISIDNGIRKMQVSGECRYSELIKKSRVQ